MAKKWLKDFVFRPSLEGLGVLDPTEMFPDWRGDPDEDEYDARKTDAQSENNGKVVRLSHLGPEPEVHKGAQRAHVYPGGLTSVEGSGNIRLLVLLPGNPADDVRCLLTPHSLVTGVQQYEALSYCWGDPGTTKPILVDGGVLEVTVNLRSALRHLRLPDEPRVLWIDAICIDQSNVDERSHQVKLMRDIYRSAEQVVVWLGRSEDHTENTFTLLKALAKESEDSKTTVRNMVREVQLSSDQQGRIEEIVEQPWFRRSWTVQEILLAKKCIVLSGWQSVSWDVLLRGTMYASAQERFWSPERSFGSSEQDFAELVSLEEALRCLKERREPNEQLLELLARFRTRSATDPHDKIYAFLGLVSDSAKLGIVMNYRISVEELYRNVAVELILRSQSLAILKFLPLSTYQYDWRTLQKARSGKKRSFDISEKHGIHLNLDKESGSQIHQDPNGRKLPSWTPDWERTEDIAAPFDDRYGHQFGAPRMINQEELSGLTISDDRTILTVAGCVFDNISEVTEMLPAIADLGIMDDEPYPDEDPAKEDRKGVRQTFKEAFEQADYGIRELYKLIWPLETLVRWEKFAGLPPKTADKDKTKEAAVDMYWQTLCAGALLPSGLEATRQSFWEWYHTMDPIRNWQQKWLKQLPFAKPMTFFGHAWKTWSNFTSFDKLYKVAFRRRMGKTKGGRLALVPRTTRAGDAIMLCRVSRFPLVVRKDEDSDRWVFVGQAYIHGIKDNDFDASLCEQMHFA
ncbi:heterokaryon incompatibility protein-domain-containing protein [Xylariaceae sp. FL1272]|nr:heterokaryon incompatibility protein-domain-containing protein [Xylariaceae sp. FL1272]